MSAVDLTRERWLRLVELARLAAALPGLDPIELRQRAARMHDTPSPGVGALRCLTNSFRWGCLWFAHADAAERMAGAEALHQLANQLGRQLHPDPLPLPPADVPKFAWQRRADVDGA